ncbi:alpha/beta fold hydrolase [Aliiglaciecola sp.]|nr:alpha/beta fold hydrolase [Aliiglaciecola sp.]
MGEYEQVRFAASDGFSLSGRNYSAKQPKAIIVVASATGVPQRFYQKFALAACQRGFTVVTFDYRGIGESAPDTLKGFDMDYRDWAQHDLNGVVAHVANLQLPVYLVGHSYGGHAIGLMDNHKYIQAAYIFGTGAGWHGWMPKLEQLKVSVMWHVIAPVLTRVQGYLGWSVLGMGEDLPLGVYKQWKRWCGFPNYFFQDPQHQGLIEKFAQVNIPIKAVNSIDDKWATPRSRDAFMNYYRGAQLDCVDLDPAHVQMTDIGHMGYFFSRSSGLWDDVFAYFDKHMVTTA